MLVDCGKCIPCRVNKKRQWALRLLHESYYSESCFFITLTYDDDSLPCDRDTGEMKGVCKDDVQKFIKKLRNLYPQNNIRYFVGSEYGSEDFTERPHYHAIFFNLPQDILSPCKGYIPGMPLEKTHKGFTSAINRKLNDIWGKGFCTIGEVNEQRAAYCAKYFVDKQDSPYYLEPNFNLMSRRPGIGRLHAESIEPKVRAYGLHACLTQRGTYVGLPRYYSRVIYTDEERRQAVAELPNRYEGKETLIENRELIEENLIKTMKLKGTNAKIISQTKNEYFYANQGRQGTAEQF